MTNGFAHDDALPGRGNLEDRLQTRGVRLSLLTGGETCCGLRRTSPTRWYRPGMMPGGEAAPGAEAALAGAKAGKEGTTATPSHRVEGWTHYYEYFHALDADMQVRAIRWLRPGWPVRAGGGRLASLDRMGCGLHATPHACLTYAASPSHAGHDRASWSEARLPWPLWRAAAPAARPNQGEEGAACLRGHRRGHTPARPATRTHRGG